MGDADVRRMGTVIKETHCKCYHGRTENVCRVAEHAVDIAVGKQVKSKILPRELVCTLHTSSTLGAKADFLN